MWPGKGANQPGMLRFSDWLAKGQADDPQVDAVAATLSNTDPINIQFTSGTTGVPEGRDADAPQHFEQRLFHRRVHEADGG